MYVLDIKSSRPFYTLLFALFKNLFSHPSTLQMLKIYLFLEVVLRADVFCSIKINRQIPQ